MPALAARAAIAHRRRQVRVDQVVHASTHNACVGTDLTDVRRRVEKDTKRRREKTGENRGGDQGLIRVWDGFPWAGNGIDREGTLET